MGRCSAQNQCGWSSISRIYRVANKNKNRRRTERHPGCEAENVSVPSSDRDPVKAYHLYASKRQEQMNSADSPFYLAVNYTKLAQSSKPWFKAAPMGINKLNSYM